MIQEPNENFGQENRNFHLAGEGKNSETVYQSQDKNLDNYSRNDYDPYQDDLGDDHVNQNVDEDLDDNGDGDDEEEDFDEKDKSDY